MFHQEASVEKEASVETIKLIKVFFLVLCFRYTQWLRNYRQAYL